MKQNVIQNPQSATMVPVIAIDGPSGSGKSTITCRLAQKLGYHLLDSGALYRILAYLFQARHGDVAVDVARLLPLTDVLKTVQFRVVALDAYHVVLGDEQLGAVIRDPKCSALASDIAKWPAVRQALLGVQHGFRCQPGLVAEGRDMGSVVFPDACIKFFLKASAKERAKRRYLQLQVNQIHASLHDIERQVMDRDAKDSGRSVAPLRQLHDAITIDTSHVSIDRVVAQMLEKIRMVIDNNRVTNL